MNTLITTVEFNQWLKGIKDDKARARIAARMISAQEGNFGDCEPAGDGISEMRIFVGPGYRIYYTRRGEVVYLLLCGGDKSTQKRDIRLAKAILLEIERGERT